MFKICMKKTCDVTNLMIGTDVTHVVYEEIRYTVIDGLIDEGHSVFGLSLLLSL